MFGLGVGEIGIIMMVAVLLFGSKLPKIARSLGSSVISFKEGLSGITEEAKLIEADVKGNLNDIEKEVKAPINV